MQQLINAFTSIPEGHLGLLIGMLAVFGGIIIAIVAVWRGISLQSRMMEIRSNLILEMRRSGLTTKEILVVLDHPSLVTMDGRQRKHSKTVLAMLETGESAPMKPPKPVAPAKNGARTSGAFS